MMMDNGSPWGSDAAHPHTPLTVWLLRLGRKVGHSGPYHPQTMGKDERFHRTLKAEVLQHCQGLDLAACQRCFEAWRQTYNLERPDEALGLAPPVSRYRESPRGFPETLPVWDYGPGDQVRKGAGPGLDQFPGPGVSPEQGLPGRVGGSAPHPQRRGLGGVLRAAPHHRD